MKKYYYVYCSYEPWGRSYIGKRECYCSPEEDTSYFGSFSDRTFKPSEKIILGVFDTVEEAFMAEQALHIFFKVDENPHFANRHVQGFHSTYTHPKGSFWVNNGSENKFLKPGEEVPTGFIKGKLPCGYREKPEYLEYKLEKLRERQRAFAETANTPESIAKRVDAQKKNGHQRGEKNSQYGTRFIHNPVTLKNTRIKKSDPLPEGWTEGAIFSDKPPEERRIMREAKAASKRLKLETKIKSLEEAEKVLEERRKLDWLRNKERQDRVFRLRELYPLYLEGGFQAVRQAGYDKSQVNFVRQLEKYIPEFVPQNGKKRGVYGNKTPKNEGY